MARLSFDAVSAPLDFCLCRPAQCLQRRRSGVPARRKHGQVLSFPETDLKHRPTSDHQAHGKRIPDEIVSASNDPRRNDAGAELACVNDMDLMISPTPENARRVMAALRAVRDACDLEQLALNIQKLAKESVHLHLLKGQGDVDVLTPRSKETGIAFHEAAGRSTEELIPGLRTPVRVAAIRDLEALDRLREGSDGR